MDITLLNVVKYYVVQGQKKMVLDNISLTFPKKGNFALIGANGAGKSTFLRILTGTELPNSGTIQRNQSMSWPLGITGNFQNYLTGKENVQFVCRLYSASDKEIKDKIDFVKDFSELGHYFEMPIQTYSSGMISRLAFGLSMAFNFDYYVVDETLSAGDARFKKKCKEIFKEKMRNSGVFMVSHEMNTLKEFCDTAVYLYKGKATIYKDLNEAIDLYKNNSTSFD
jgi:capsular polysaccharide transport system ATP-binding protein